MKRSRIIIFLIIMMLLGGCSRFGKVKNVAVMGKADTDEAVIVLTDYDGREVSRKIDYPAEEYFGDEAIYYSADRISYDSWGYSDLKNHDRIENAKGFIMYHIEGGCTYVYEDDNMMVVYKDGQKLREHSQDDLKFFKAVDGLFYYCDLNDVLYVYDVMNDELVKKLDVSALQAVNVTVIDGNIYLVGTGGYTLLEDWQIGSTYVYPVEFEAVENCRGKYLTVVEGTGIRIFKTYEVSFDKYRMYMSDDIDDDTIGYVNFEKLYPTWYEKGYEVINFFSYLGG